jgi:hypothetical protein
MASHPNTAFLLGLACAVSISCAPKPVPVSEPSPTKALLYYLPIGSQWLRQFPHNSLYRPTTIEECEGQHWYKNRSGDFDRAYTKFKSLIQPGDVVWFWGGPNGGMFNTYRGVDVPEGICLLRQNKVVAVLMTHMASNIE